MFNEVLISSIISLKIFKTTIDSIQHRNKASLHLGATIILYIMLLRFYRTESFSGAEHIKSKIEEKNGINRIVEKKNLNALLMSN